MTNKLGKKSAPYSFTFYRRAGASLARLFGDCRARGIERVGLYGLSDLAEIAVVRALDQGVNIIAVCDATTSRERFLGISVVGQLQQAPEVQAWALTDIADTRRSWRRLLADAGEVSVLTPDILGLDAE